MLLAGAIAAFLPGRLRRAPAMDEEARIAVQGARAFFDCDLEGLCRIATSEGCEFARRLYEAGFPLPSVSDIRPVRVVEDGPEGRVWRLAVRADGKEQDL